MEKPEVCDDCKQSLPLYRVTIKGLPDVDDEEYWLCEDCCEKYAAWAAE